MGYAARLERIQGHHHNESGIGDDTGLSHVTDDGSCGKLGPVLSGFLFRRMEVLFRRTEVLFRMMARRLRPFYLYRGNWRMWLAMTGSATIRARSMEVDSSAVMRRKSTSAARQFARGFGRRWVRLPQAVRELRSS
jgi:hypothetical protein